MYGYFDESILVIDGVKYCFLGFVVYSQKCTEKTILQECAKAEQRLKYREEIKYTNIRSPKLKHAILQKIKSDSLHFQTVYQEIVNNDQIHNTINKLIQEILTDFQKTFLKSQLNILYDKVSYRINIKEIVTEFDFVKSFALGNSKREPGIQNADWIAGEAGENFRQQKNRQ